MLSPDIRPLSRSASSCHQCWVSSQGSWQSPELSSSSNTQSLSGMRAGAEPGYLYCDQTQGNCGVVVLNLKRWCWKWGKLFELRFLRTETPSYDWAGRQVRELMPEIGRYDARPGAGCRVSAQHNCRPDETWMIISVFKPAFPCLWRD